MVRPAVVLVSGLLATSLVAASDVVAVDEPLPAWSGWVTSPTDPARRLMPIAEASTAATVTTTVDPADRSQRWQGVGAALTDASVSLLRDRPAARALLFDPDATAGARLDLLRLPLSATDLSTSWWTWDWDARRRVATPPAEALDAVGVVGDLTALNAELEVVATPWTAPASMKNGRRVDGGSLQRKSERAYGDLLTAQIEWLVGAGVPVAAATIVNEPGHSGNYPTMTMTNGQLAGVGSAIGPALTGMGVELWAVDHNWNDRDRVDAVVAGAPGVFAAAAFHCYGGSPDQMAGLAIPTIVTECTGTDDTWENTFQWDARNLVVDAALAGSTGLMMWNLALDPDHGPKISGGCETCRGLLTIDPTTGSVDPTPDFYTLAHVARAARPGDVRVATTPAPGVPMTAFVDISGSVGVYGHNDTGADQVVAIRFGDGTQHRFQIGAGEMFTLRGPAPEGGPTPPTVVEGDILIDEAGTSWFVSTDGSTPTRHRITSIRTLVCDRGLGGAELTVTDAELATIAVGDARVDQSCILRAPEGDAHVVHESGERAWIPDAETWFCEIDNGLPVVDTTRAYIDGLPETAWHECDSKPRRGRP